MTFEVDRDGERLEVAREAQVAQYHRVGEASHSTDYEEILTVDGHPELAHYADAVTTDLAEWIYDEFHIDVEEHELEVIDPESEEVTRL